MSWLRRNAFPIVAAVLLLISATSFALTRSGQEAALSEQGQQLEELRDRRAELEQDQRDRRSEVANDSVGTDTARLEADEELISQMLNTALRWQNHDEYVRARTTMMDSYGLDEESPFMTAFLPEPETNVDSQGEEHALIDVLGLDSRVEDFRTEVLSVEGTEYSYVVFADVLTTSDDGAASASSTSTLMLTTDGDGGVSDLEGYASESRVRTSGPH